MIGFDDYDSYCDRLEPADDGTCLHCGDELDMRVNAISCAGCEGPHPDGEDTEVDDLCPHGYGPEGLQNCQQCMEFRDRHHHAAHGGVCPVCGEETYGYAPCACPNNDAADGGEENDDMEAEITHEQFSKQLVTLSPMSLVSMKNAIDSELKRRRDSLAKELAATEHAIEGTKPRATRSDAGRPRAPKQANDVQRDEKGVAV